MWGEKEELSENQDCVYCLDNKKEYALVPCGHKCLCNICKEIYEINNIKECPLCKQNFNQIIKIFD